MDYEDEMKISIKEIIEYLDDKIESNTKTINYYEELIELKEKHHKDTFTERDTLFACKCEKNTTECIKIGIEKILKNNDIPEEYYKVEEKQ